MNTSKEISRIKKEKIAHDSRCRGCSQHRQDLTPSHIIRKSARQDLETEPDNITIHCIDCHADWDSNDIKRMSKLHDFADNLMYISKVDEGKFMRLMYKIQDLINIHSKSGI